MKKHALKFLTPSIAALCLGLLPNSSKAAVLYFDPSGSTAPTTGDTYTWNTSSDEWSTTDALTSSPEDWKTADAACFTASDGFTGNITVDVSGTIDLAGIFDGALAPDGCTVTLSGGTLSWNSGTDGLDVGGSDGDPMYFDTTMAGAGEIEIEGSDSVYFNDANTYTGGTELAGSGGVNFGNSTAFGTGAIIEDTTTAVLASEGSSALTVANAVTTKSGDTMVYAGGTTAATTFSGNWALPALGATTTVQVNAGTAMTISGIISGAGNFVKSGTGTMIVSGPNTYTGTTTISAGILQLGAANTIATSSGVILSGGTLSPGGFSHSMGSTTLTLSGTSTTSMIDFGLGGTLSLANSSAISWGSGDILDLVNWDGSDDELQIGTDDTGLTGSQLDDIIFDGDTTSEAAINAEGFIYEVPEPSSIALAGIGGLSVLLMRRKKA